MAPSCETLPYQVPDHLGENAGNDEPVVGKDFIVRWEPVNITLVEKAMRLSAMRCASTEHYDFFQILWSIRNRVVRVRNGKGWIAVLEREAKAVGSLMNRLFSGIGGLEDDDLPDVIKSELQRGVPRSLAGLSIFAFNKCLRYLCRHGLKIFEVDLVNAVFSILCEVCDVPRVVLEFRDNREAVMEQVLAYFHAKGRTHITRDNVKELFISLGFGGSTWSWMRDNMEDIVELDDVCGEFLEQIEEALRTVRGLLANQYPVEFQLMKKAGKLNPYASLAFHVYVHHERLSLQRMREVSGEQCVGPEHDGIAATGDDPDSLLQRCAAAVAPLRVALKLYPEDPFERFAQQFPELDWTLQADMPTKEYADLLTKCRTYIKEGAAMVKVNRYTFARLVAAQLGPMVNVPIAEGEKRTHFEMFTGYGYWQSKHRDDLTAVTLKILGGLTRPMIRMKWQRQGIEQDPPPPFNDITFAAGLGDTVLGLLATKPMAPALDGDVTRHKVLHNDCYVSNSCCKRFFFIVEA